MPIRRLPPTSMPSRATVNDMEPEARPARLVPARFAAAVVAACVFLPCAVAQVAAPGRTPIYDCIDANGKRIRSDRPILDCKDKDQRLLNPDGSVKQVVPPTPTADERAAIEAREREASAERAARNDAIRRDRNLVGRFPDE